MSQIKFNNNFTLLYKNNVLQINSKVMKLIHFLGALKGRSYLAFAVIVFASLLWIKNASGRYPCPWGYREIENCTWPWTCKSSKFCDCTPFDNMRENGDNKLCQTGGPE